MPKKAKGAKGSKAMVESDDDSIECLQDLTFRPPALYLQLMEVISGYFRLSHALKPHEAQAFELSQVLRGGAPSGSSRSTPVAAPKATGSMPARSSGSGILAKK